jgi:hypothetical protein
LSERWAACVERELGAAYVPSEARGVKVTRIHRADYLTKLGLEISDMGHKGARGGNRHPWDIAQDYAATGSPSDALTWRRFARGIKGARQLTWSRGLKRELGIEAVEDAQIVERHEDGDPSAEEVDADQLDELAQDMGDAWEPPRAVLGKVAAKDWRRVRSCKVGGRCAPLHIITRAEQDGAPGMRRALHELERARRGAA